MKSLLRPPFSISWSWQENAISPCNVGIPLTDRGFRYGQHLFETMAVRGGHVIFFEEHWKRLVAAAKRNHFPFPAEWHDGMRDFLKQSLLHDGMLRVFLTAGEGALGSPIVAPQLFVFWEETTFPSQQALEQGASLVSLEEPIGTIRWGEKTGNYWSHLQALEAARRVGAEEGLVFDQEGYLISAAMANVILWLEENNEIKIITPPQSRGARDGVVLDWVRKQVSGLLEEDIRQPDLKKVVAMALTNSRLGVMPVATLDGRILPGISFSQQRACYYLNEINSYSKK